MYISTFNSNDGSIGKILSESVRRFCQSIELCDGYLRGYYGLKTASDRLLALLLKSPNFSPSSVTSTDSRDLMIPSVQTLNRLNGEATSRLVEITRVASRSSYEESEIIAAKELLDKSTFQHCGEGLISGSDDLDDAFANSWFHPALVRGIDGRQLR